MFEVLLYRQRVRLLRMLRLLALRRHQLAMRRGRRPVHLRPATHHILLLAALGHRTRHTPRGRPNLRLCAARETPQSAGVLRGPARVLAIAVCPSSSRGVGGRRIGARSRSSVACRCRAAMVTFRSCRPVRCFCALHNPREPVARRIRVRLLGGLGDAANWAYFGVAQCICCSRLSCGCHPITP